MEKLEVKKLHHGAAAPARASEDAAGYDLCACIDAPLTIEPGQRKLIPTGIAIAIAEPGVAAFLFGRSGLGIKHGLSPSNAVGVVDADYRGEVMVGLTNHSDSAYTIQPGERIAQMVLMPVLAPEIVMVDTLSETKRGTGGFGSTGR